ncbi:MAG: hypothetical protein KJ727_00850, partial [Acidobacteria bacterium]|nr:hypothetical protein [Acidobacteriota bacterium]
SATRHCVDPYTDRYSTFNSTLNSLVITPPPPNLESTGTAIPNWIYNETNDFNANSFEIKFRVSGKQADGGESWLEIFTHAMPDGIHFRRGLIPESVDRPADIDFQTRNSGEEHTSIKISGFSWYWPTFIKLDKTFSLEDITLDYGGTGTGDASCQPHLQNRADSTYDLSWRFVIAARKNIKAILEPMDSAENKWKPEPGDIREYKLTLEDINPDEVAAVRFTLLDTSEHEGVATNAGNHLLNDACPDCTLGRKTEAWARQAFTKNWSGEDSPVSRLYTHYNECPIGSLPDMFFRNSDNPGFDMGEDAVSENLQYTVSQQITLEDVTSDVISARVCVKDAAASAKMKAEIKIAGIWYLADTRGTTADTDGKNLLIPLDRDEDGLQDGWEEEWSVTDPDSDDDTHQDALHTGDGLTAFEEYRGIYSDGRHYRLSPLEKDIFVYDYAGCFYPHLRTLVPRFLDQKLHLREMQGDEFRDDLINYTNTDHKAGDQYILVLMTHDQNPELTMGLSVGVASHIGPPTEDHNTIVLRDYRDASRTGYYGWEESEEDQNDTAGTLGHEIGHNLNLLHHGQYEGIRNIPGEGRSWVACLQGQHSGDRDCFMTYRSARYFIAMVRVPENFEAFYDRGRVQEYSDPKGNRLYFCKTRTGSGLCGETAEGRGECLSRVKVKSY